MLVIVNPQSRGGRDALAPTLALLRDTGLEAEVAETTAPRYATRPVRDRMSTSPVRSAAVLSLGGDGTAMEVASTLAELPDAPPLGIVAVGTANILARSLGIPVNSSRAVAALLNAEVVPIDIGRVKGGLAFAIGLGVGLDATMIGGTSSVLKRRIGYVAYALSALRAGLRLERFRATITMKHVRIETDPPRSMQADGELLGLTPVEIRVEPNAVRVLVPSATLRRWRIPRLAATRGHTEQLKSCTP